MTVDELAAVLVQHTAQLTFYTNKEYYRERVIVLYFTNRALVQRIEPPGLIA